MKKINKISLIIFGYSEMITLALVVNSKLDKVKEFSVFEDNNEDKFFRVISHFISNNACFNNVLYSCGPGGFTTIRRILSYVKALKFNNCSNTKFIGLSNLFIIAYYLNYKSETNEYKYILSILNYSKDNFVQVYQKKKNSNFILESLSDIKNIDLNRIENYLKLLNLSTKNIHCVYLGENHSNVSFLNNIQLVDRYNIVETISKISNLIEIKKIDQNDFKNFFEEKFDPLYGKPPSIN